MNTKLYVGNLPYETTETDLQTLFEATGQVSTDQHRSRSSDRPGAWVRVCRNERRRKRTARHLAARQARVRWSEPDGERGETDAFAVQWRRRRIRRRPAEARTTLVSDRLVSSRTGRPGSQTVRASVRTFRFLSSD